MKRFKRTANDEPPMLNLTPLMDMFVGLIPFLLLSAAFIRVGGLEVNTPASGADSKKQEAKRSDILSLSFEVDESKVTVSGYTEGFEQPIKDIKQIFPIDQLDQMKLYVTGLRSRFQDFGNPVFYASPTTRYESAINVMNSIKEMRLGKEVVLAAGVVE